MSAASGSAPNKRRAAFWAWALLLVSLMMPGSGHSSIMVVWPAPDRTLIVLIGVDRYTSPDLTKLAFAVADANALRQMLVQRWGVRDVDVRMLLNEQASRTNVLNALKSLPGQYGRVVMFFAGQGLPEMQKDDRPARLALHDTKVNELGTAITPRDMLSALVQMDERVREQFLFLDACYGDQFARGVAMEMQREPKLYRELAKRRTVIVGTKLALERPDRGHGSVTAAALDCMKNSQSFGQDKLWEALGEFIPWQTFLDTNHHDAFSYRLQDFVPPLPVDEELSKGAKALPSVREPQRIEQLAKNVQHRALLIGIGKYDYNPPWPQLNNPESDVTKLAAVLEKRYGFAVTPRFDLTRQQLEDEVLLTAQQKYGPQDELLIFISAHGYLDTRLDKLGQPEGFIVPRDGKAPNPLFPYGLNHYEYSSLRKILAAHPCEHILLILDACYAGVFGEIGEMKSQTIKEDFSNIPNVSSVVETLRLRTRRFITSAGKEPVSDGPKGKNSPFALALLRVLEAPPRPNGFLRLADLEGPLADQLPGNKLPRPGRFSLNEDGSNFFFFDRTPPAPIP